MATTIGTSGPDSLQGTEADDLLFGLGGDDFISGGAGEDRLEGGSGNDTLYGGLGADLLLGGAGNDIFGDISPGDVIIGGSGVDRLDVSFSGADSAITFTAGANGTGNLGGASYSGIEAFGITGGAFDDTLTGGRFADVMEGGDGDDLVSGGDGNDTIRDWSGNDTLIGGAGADSISDEAQGTSDIDSGAGNDDVHLYSRYDDVFGGPAGEAAATIVLGSGNDTLDIRLPAQLISGTVDANGGSGVDTLGLHHWDATQDIVAALDGVSAGDLEISATKFEALDIQSGSGDDELTGGKYADQLDSGSGADVVHGMGGDDDIRIGQGGFADGGRGHDHITLDFGASDIGVEFVFSTGTVEVDEDTSFSSMESYSAIGSQGDDDIVGSDGADEMSDGAGDDRLFGGRGDDVFIRGTVQPTRSWGEAQANQEEAEDIGTDIIDGGAGYDTLTFAKKALFIAIFHWVDAVKGEVGIDLMDQDLNSGLAAGLTLESIERIDGGIYVDKLLGDSRANEFHASEGNDTLHGRGGNDKIDGGSGADELWGGAGRDQFFYGSESFSSYRSFPSYEDTSGDHIHDFARGLDKLVFDTPRPDGAIVTSGHGSNGEEASSSFYFDIDSHKLWMTYDGDDSNLQGEQVCVAVLDNVARLSANDFLFV